MLARIGIPFPACVIPSLPISLMPHLLHLNHMVCIWPIGTSHTHKHFRSIYPRVPRVPLAYRKFGSTELLHESSSLIFRNVILILTSKARPYEGRIRLNMDPTAPSGNNTQPMSVPTRSKLLSGSFKQFFNKPALSHPQKNLTVQLHNAEVRANMSSASDITSSANSGFPKISDAPGEQFEPRQTATSEDYTPDPSNSIPLSGPRQRLVDDVNIP